MIQAINSGSITLNNNLSDANEGTIQAVGSGSSITINVADTGTPSGGNSGTMEALSGGTISYAGDGLNSSTVEAVGSGSQFDFSLGVGYTTITVITNENQIVAEQDGTVQLSGISGTAADDLLHVDNNGGTIAAYDSGSVVELSNVGIGGGTLATSNPEGDSGGVIEIVTPALGDTNITYFNGSSEGTLTVDGFVQVDAGADLVLIGTIDNQGTIDVDSGVSGADLVIDGTVTLDGSGTITLAGTNDTMTIGASDSLMLTGTNSITGGGTLSNAGTLNADGSVAISAAITGSGTITVSGGTLH